MPGRWRAAITCPTATLTGSLRGDLVFLEPYLGVGELAISDHRSSQPTLDELLRVASDAHVAGLMTGRAGIVHLHLGDGERGLDLVRRALDSSELPARVFNPTHVNRRRALFDEAVALARRGCVVDVTAFPVDEGEDAYDAAEAVERFLGSGAPPGSITVSSDAGGCLPCFDADGRVCRMEVGSSGALLATLRALLERGLPLADALPPFTTNPARLLRLAAKGTIAPGADADLVALDAAGAAHTVIVRGEIHVADGRPCGAGCGGDAPRSEVQARRAVDEEQRRFPDGQRRERLLEFFHDGRTAGHLPPDRSRAAVGRSPGVTSDDSRSAPSWARSSRCWWPGWPGRSSCSTSRSGCRRCRSRWSRSHCSYSACSPGSGARTSRGPGFHDRLG